MKIVQLEDRADDKVRTYSLGMKQRLGIAQAIVEKHHGVISADNHPDGGLFLQCLSVI
ncbi:hypothetical protein [Oceanobacillus sp. CFH 90083]|uniref:hypothetical protein n=1 Tax=Oceanobacillus sp. CFH 90083 TaxID=2592336 RepID=UPI0018833E5E|nr:hypothetical protein [Oceanobacillus sp. CFH 90083]